MLIFACCCYSQHIISHQLYYKQQASVLYKTECNLWKKVFKREKKVITLKHSNSVPIIKHFSLNPDTAVREYEPHCNPQIYYSANLTGASKHNRLIPDMGHHPLCPNCAICIAVFLKASTQKLSQSSRYSKYDASDYTCTTVFRQHSYSKQERNFTNPSTSTKCEI